LLAKWDFALVLAAAVAKDVAAKLAE